MAVCVRTVVLLLRDRVAAASFSGKSLVNAVSLARTDIEEPASAVGMALASLNTKAGDTVVLSADLWTHVLEFPASTMHGLHAEALEQALLFETESLSGLNAGEAAIAVQPLDAAPGRCRYWVSLYTHVLRSQLEGAVTAYGGRLVGTAHPGGLPVSLADSPTNAWLRVEFWRGQTLRIASNGRTFTLRTEDDGVTHNDPAATIENWRKTRPDAVAVETLFEIGGRLEASGVSLDNEDFLRRWLSAWQAALTRGAQRVPLHRTPKAPLSQQQRTAIAAGLALVVAGACYAYHGVMERDIARASKTAELLEAPGKELEEVKKQVETANKALETERKANDVLKSDVESSEQAFASHKLRLADLLRHLSSKPQRTWTLRRIESMGQDLRLVGSTLHPEHIGAVATEMAAELRPLGWDVDPAHQKAQNTLEDGAPWTFELNLHDIAPSGGAATFELPPDAHPRVVVPASAPST